jgi:hypothetical protein
MSLNPIISLSVALAEAPGTCAFFLGSGVSRDAGVATGQEIMREGLRKLHQLETESAEPANDAELEMWLTETDRDQITYAELLALITPDQSVRREYLAAFFDGKEPGRTHELLAGLAERGLARVFITTNFDRLLEHALQARGIEPVVIASDADLQAAAPREHARCIVLKPHGDYLRQTIRNTPEELAELEPAMTAEWLRCSTATALSSSAIQGPTKGSLRHSAPANRGTGCGGSPVVRRVSQGNDPS